MYENVNNTSFALDRGGNTSTHDKDSVPVSDLLREAPLRLLPPPACAQKTV
jgi:hypothetical protein